MSGSSRGRPDPPGPHPLSAAWRPHDSAGEASGRAVQITRAIAPPLRGEASAGRLLQAGERAGVREAHWSAQLRGRAAAAAVRRLHVNNLTCEGTQGGASELGNQRAH